MKKIDKSCLPKNGKNIDWKNSINCIVSFQYRDIKGELLILDYKDRYLTVKFNDVIKKIHTSSLLKCELGDILNVKTNKFKYEIGTVFKDKKRNLTLIDKEYKKNKSTKKWYKYRCNNDGNEDWISENDLNKGVGCNVCANKKVLKGINDINTKTPYLVQYLYDKNDAYLHTPYSKDKIYFKCPTCGTILLKEVVRVNANGFSCNKCSDGISYPNKVMMSLLEQLNIEYIREYSPQWLTTNIKGGAYDFYIPSMELIIEMDGGFHKKAYANNKEKLKRQIERDDIKNKLAKHNNIKIIRIDCDYRDKETRGEFIKNNIKESELKHIFTLHNVDWVKVYKFATENIVKNICENYEINKNIIDMKDIAQNNHIHITTLIHYLKIGNDIGWCNYKPKKRRKRKVKVIELDKIYKSTNSCAIQLTKLFNKKYGQACISNACSQHKPYKGLHFEFID